MQSSALRIGRRFRPRLGCQLRGLGHELLDLLDQLPGLGEEGIHTVHFRAVDHAGNVETVKNAQILIDRTPPELSAALEERKKGAAIRAWLEGSKAHMIKEGRLKITRELKDL